MEEIIKKHLNEMGFDPSIKGYHALVKCVALKFKHRRTKISKLFQVISESEGTSFQRYNTVERNIKYAIEKAFKRNKDKGILKKFKRSPTNVKFINTLVHTIYKGISYENTN